MEPADVDVGQAQLVLVGVVDVEDEGRAEDLVLGPVGDGVALEHLGREDEVLVDEQSPQLYEIR